jgi:hypothetical protein
VTTNPILDEIHATRQKLLEEHNGDLHAYVESARKRALESGRPIIQLKQRTRHCTFTFVAWTAILIGCTHRDEDNLQRSNVAPGHSPAPTVGLTPDPALNEKRIEYRDAMKELVDLLQERYRDGTDNTDLLLAGQLALTDAELALASTKEKRLAVLEASLQILKESEHYQQVRTASGVGRTDEMVKAKAARLHGEILILEETYRDD